MTFGNYLATFGNSSEVLLWEKNRAERHVDFYTLDKNEEKNTDIGPEVKLRDPNSAPWKQGTTIMTLAYIQWNLKISHNPSTTS